MNIAFDVQPLLDQEKTGIGFCTAGFVDSICRLYPEDAYVFRYFSYKNNKRYAAKIAPFLTRNTQVQNCDWFSDRWYRAIWNFIPIPYRFFFKQEAQISQFFNFYVPPGVRGIPVSIVHDMCYKSVSDTVRLKTKIMLNLSLAKSCKRAKKIVTISQFSKREIVRYLHVPDDKVAVIPLGVNHERYRPNMDLEAQNAVLHKHGIPSEFFLYVGTIEPRKNIERMILAYAKLHDTLEIVPKLVLVGRKGWLYQSIFETVRRLHLQNDVIFCGYVADEDIPLLLNRCKAFVFPSIYEGFGLPALEAMACGAPVLTSNTTSLPEVVGDAALQVDPYSVDEIYAGMRKLALDDNLREALRQKGIERARQFTWESAGEKLHKIYETLLDEVGK